MEDRYYVYTTPDFENEVTDVVLFLDGIECWVKGFDDCDWREARDFAINLSKELGVNYVGEVCKE